MTIRIEGTSLYDNEIHFADLCQVVANKLTELRTKAMEDGDIGQFAGQTYELFSPMDHEEVIAIIDVIN